MKELTQEAIKKALGETAATFVEEGMLVGLGTGTTATFFIDSLIKRCRSGLKISAVATSARSMEQAKKGGIPIYESERVGQLDLTIDGADEIDSHKRMIKGGGGALVREKILASSSKRMVVIVEEKKFVETLGAFGLPIEIIPFCYLTTLAKIKNLGYDGQMRYLPDGSHYITDNGNLIFDVHTPKTFLNPEERHEKLAALPGVVDTGFFFNLPIEILVGYGDGRVELRK